LVNVVGGHQRIPPIDVITSDCHVVLGDDVNTTFVIQFSSQSSSIPLLAGFVTRLPFSQAGDMVLDFRVQALMKLEDDVRSFEVMSFVHHLLETVDVLINSS
jgi:hypothetical protein